MSAALRAWLEAAARLVALLALAPVAALLVVVLPLGLALGGRPAATVDAGIRVFIGIVGRLLRTPVERDRPDPSTPSERTAAWLIVHAVAGGAITATAVLLWWFAVATAADMAFPFGLFVQPVLGALAITWLAVPLVLRGLAALAVAVLVTPRRSDGVRQWGRRITRRGAALLLGPVALLLLAVMVVGLLLFPVFGAGIPVVERAIAYSRRFVAFTGRLLGTPAVRAYASPPGSTWSTLGAVARDRQNLRDVVWLGAHGVLGVLAYLAGATLTRLVVHHGGSTSIPALVVGAMFLIVALAVALILRIFTLLAAALLSAPPSAALARRVTQLAASRAATVDAQAAELRRIERDLHDGAQARLAAVRMTLGLASQTLHSDLVKTAALLAEARDDAGRALSELRDLVRGIHPPVLADRGLPGGLEAAALLCPVPVDVSVAVEGRSQAPVESAVYFAAAEALANVGRHSGAERAWLRVDHDDGVLRLVVGDDGRGGADPRRGSGLRGIERRLAAFDGTLAVASPPGGPTELTMEVPCQLNSVSSSPRTTSCSATD